MTRANTNNWWLTVRKKDVRIGFIIALAIHLFLFFPGGTIFMKPAQYGVQSFSGASEVALVDTIPQSYSSFAGTDQSVQKKREMGAKTQQTGNQGVRVSANSNPNYFQNPPPLYPEFAKQMRQEGLVILAVTVDTNGIPIKVEINKSSGYQLLDQAALKTISHWKFLPGRIGDLPVESKVTIPIRFRLRE